MRALLALVLLGGCFGVRGGAGTGSVGATRPGVMPLLSELPGDPGKRDAVLDSANATPSPEQRKGTTTKERKVETAAATAAAILGGLFSKTKSVTIGSASQFDENLIVAPKAVPPLHPPSTGNAKAEDAAAPDAPPAPPADDAGPSNADLIPWIKVK